MADRAASFERAAWARNVGQQVRVKTKPQRPSSTQNDTRAEAACTGEKQHSKWRTGSISDFKSWRCGCAAVPELSCVLLGVQGCVEARNKRRGLA